VKKDEVKEETDDEHDVKELEETVKKVKHDVKELKETFEDFKETVEEKFFENLNLLTHLNTKIDELKEKIEKESLNRHT
jgi:uncharacterized protein Yka (UPF0111/DUF47 family)